MPCFRRRNPRRAAFAAAIHAVRQLCAVCRVQFQKANLSPRCRFIPANLYADRAAASMSDALDRYYAIATRSFASGGMAPRSGTVSTALSRAQNKYAAFLRDDSAKRRARHRAHQRRTHLANLHLAKRSMTELVVDDYFVDPPAKTHRRARSRAQRAGQRKKHTSSSIAKASSERRMRKVR